jgi:hypothetical protein
VGAPLTCSCDVSGCCETPVSHKCDTHDDGTDFSDIAAARREGVIEGLETAAKITSDPSRSNWSLNREIRAEIERRKRGEE